MEWLFDNVPVAIVLFVIYSIAAAVKRARDKKTEHEASHDETAEQRRVREIQERIRRIAAERRGGRVPAETPRQPTEMESPAEPTTMGGSLKRMLEEIERRAQPAPQPPPLVVRTQRAEVERQEQLADELHALEEAKSVMERRAAHLRDAERAQANPEVIRRTAVRARLLEELHDPQSLRRAFVLREVLGPPVGLR